MRVKLISLTFILKLLQTIMYQKSIVLFFYLSSEQRLLFHFIFKRQEENCVLLCQRYYCQQQIASELPFTILVTGEIDSHNSVRQCYLSATTLGKADQHSEQLAYSWTRARPIKLRTQRAIQCDRKIPKASAKQISVKQFYVTVVDHANNYLNALCMFVDSMPP